MGRKFLRIGIPLVVCLALSGASAAAAHSSFPAAPVSGGAQQITLGNGVLALMGPWKFRLGDNMAWAQPGYNDSGWQDYTLLHQGWPNSIFSLHSDLDPGWAGHGHRGAAGYGWYRIHVRLGAVPGSLRVLVPYIDDASTVYWDGQKLGGYGDPSKRLAYCNQRTQSFSIPVALAQSGEHLLAIRTWAEPFYSVRNNSRGGGVRGAPLLATPASAREIQAAQSLRLRLKLAIQGARYLLPFTLIALVSLVLFVYNRSRREYLWAGLTLFSFIIGDLATAIDRFSGTRWLNFREFAVVDAFSGGLILFILLALQWLLGLQERRDMRYANIAAGATVWAMGVGTDIQAFDLVNASATMSRIFYLAFRVSLALCLPCFVWMVLTGVRKQGRRAWLMLTPGFVVVALLLWSFLGANVVPFAAAYVGSLILEACVPASVLAILLGRFVRQWREHQRLEADFENARQVQQLLVPSSSPKTPGFTVESVYLPASEVGGDFFQILPGDNDSLLIIVGDVSGKGLKAAMTVSTIIGALRGCDLRGPADVLAHLNRVLCGHITGFATCCAALIAADGAMTLANAGHIPPYRNGEAMATEGGLPLGMAAGIEYEEARVQLAPGDRLTFVSDGVLEATSKTRELFGFDRTQAISTQPAAQIAETARAFGQQDDITVLSVTRTSKSISVTETMTADSLRE